MKVPGRIQALVSFVLLLGGSMPVAQAGEPHTVDPFGASPGTGGRSERSKPETISIRPPINPRCVGEYSDFLSDLLPANIAFEKSPDATYTYCLRTVATYEHLFYGRGGKLKRTYLRAQAHGTGFAYKQKDGDYYLATNQHVAEYPDVTDEEHPVEGIPAGSRKVREIVKIVANDRDDYEPGQIPLTKVIADPGLDIAVLKTHHPLRMMPYRIGSSSGLRPGNIVAARGFPLGVFPASNSGKVINPYQEDSDPPWEHVDFVTDALLNSGSSGSPVFAVSCKTGEMELVGIYHAHYTGGTGLGLVIGIDGIRDVLDNQRLPRVDLNAAQATLAEDRRRGHVALEMSAVPLFFPFADRTVRAQRGLDGSVEFTLFRDFPLSDGVQMGIVDHQGQLYLDVPANFPRPLAFGELDPALREPLERLSDGMWHALRVSLDYRGAETKGGAKTEIAHRLSDIKSSLKSREAEQRDLLSTVDFEADDLSWPALTAPVAPPPDGGVSAPIITDGGETTAANP